MVTAPTVIASGVLYKINKQEYFLCIVRAVCAAQYIRQVTQVLLVASEFDEQMTK